MVIPVDIDVNLLAALGKGFSWEKPACCPKCGGRLWWHGFVPAYFSCLALAVLLRRLFCPHCHSVHRLRPSSHWRRFQSPISVISQIIAHRQENGRWRPDLPRAPQRQWWRRLATKVQLCLGLSFAGTFPDAFLILMNRGAIPVSSVMECGDG
ncbi:MAG: hypothetical protein AB1568_17520 [Thermodesulfobacteriota bacterium]